MPTVIRTAFANRRILVRCSERETVELKLAMPIENDSSFWDIMTIELAEITATLFVRELRAWHAANDKCSSFPQPAELGEGFHIGTLAREAKLGVTFKGKSKSDPTEDNWQECLLELDNVERLAAVVESAVHWLAEQRRQRDNPAPVPTVAEPGTEMERILAEAREWKKVLNLNPKLVSSPEFGLWAVKNQSTMARVVKGEIVL